MLRRLVAGGQPRCRPRRACGGAKESLGGQSKLCGHSKVSVGIQSSLWAFKSLGGQSALGRGGEVGRFCLDRPLRADDEAVAGASVNAPPRPVPRAPHAATIHPTQWWWSPITTHPPTPQAIEVLAVRLYNRPQNGASEAHLAQRSLLAAACVRASAAGNCLPAPGRTGAQKPRRVGKAL